MTRLLLLCSLCAASAVFAQPGRTLYVTPGGATLLKEPKAKAAKVAQLHAGTEVRWLGVSEKDRRFHEVEAGGKKGFVTLSEVSPNRPAPVTSASGKPMAAESFAASGAAVKGTPQSASAGERGPAHQKAAAELEAVDAVNAKATPDAVQAKDKALREAK